MKAVEMHSKDSFVDAIGISLLSFFFIAYSIFSANFAKIHIRVSGFKAPVFIGELLLGICILLMAVKASMRKEPARWYHYAIGAYVVFVLAKALYGNTVWGALAFRNAALFYYPLFIVIGYYFYEDMLWVKRPFAAIALGVISLAFFLKTPNDYFCYTYVVLAAIFFSQINRRWVRLSGYFLCIALFLINNPMNATKGMLVSLFVTFLYLGNRGWYLVKSRLSGQQMKIYVVSAVAALVIIAPHFFIKDATKKRAAVWMRLDKVLQQYRHYDNGIKDIQRQQVALPQYPVKIFTGTGAEIKLALNRSSQKQKPPATSLIQSHATPLNGPLAGNAIRNGDALKQEPVVINSSTAVYVQPQSIRGPVVERTRSGEEDFYNILWRMFVWKDMLGELLKSGNVFGIAFGKPFHSVSLEYSKYKEGTGWGTGDWVGWLEPHNSYIHILYRSGIIGFFLIGVLWYGFAKIVRIFSRARNIKGILISSVLLYWFCLANFIVLFELPYFAIPFWTMCGFTLAYAVRQKAASV